MRFSRVLQLDFELIKVDLVLLADTFRKNVHLGIAGSITLLVNVGEALGISGCCSKELVIADLANTKFTFLE